MGQSTGDRILKAALDLFSEHGYTDVTTRRIASAAGVNEVTLFRLFGTKKLLYIGVFERFSLKPGPDVLEGITYELNTDLRKFGHKFVKLFLNNLRIVKMSSLALASEIPEVQSKLGIQIHELKYVIEPYFITMKKRGSLFGDPVSSCDLFVDLLFGYAGHIERSGRVDELSNSLDRLISIFASGIASTVNS